jgi:hypothetical protein
MQSSDVNLNAEHSGEYEKISRDAVLLVVVILRVALLFPLRLRVRVAPSQHPGSLTSRSTLPTHIHRLTSRSTLPPPFPNSRMVRNFFVSSCHSPPLITYISATEASHDIVLFTKMISMTSSTRIYLKNFVNSCHSPPLITYICATEAIHYIVLFTKMISMTSSTRIYEKNFAHGAPIARTAMYFGMRTRFGLVRIVDPY